MEKQKKVIDASVIVKWFSKEEDSDKAIEIREEYTSGKLFLVLPSFAVVEVINALRYKEKNEEKVKMANEYLAEMNIKFEKITKFIMDKAIENSFKHNITIYDSVYVALAQIHGCEMITTDKELYKIPNVVPLEKV